MFPRIRSHILTRCSQYYICLPGRGLSLRQSWKTSPLQGGSPGAHAASSYPCAPGSRPTTHKRPSIKFICGLVEENRLHTQGSRVTVSQSLYVTGSSSEHLPPRQLVHPTLQHPGLINPHHCTLQHLGLINPHHHCTLQHPGLIKLLLLHTATHGSYQTPPIAHSNTRVLSNSSYCTLQHPGLTKLLLLHTTPRS